MCHRIKALFYDFGESSAVYEGGKYLGFAKEVISPNIGGTLKQKLIEAKAILALALVMHGMYWHVVHIHALDLMIEITIIFE
ncbi:putative glutaredoxin-like, plant II [Helianthus anomalus]